MEMAEPKHLTSAVRKVTLMEQKSGCAMMGRVAVGKMAPVVAHQLLDL